MPSETPFRIALLIILAATMVVGVPHRLRAASTGEKISHKEEGYAFAIVLRMAGLLLWIATLAYLFSPPSVHWAQIPIHASVRWIGVVLGMCGPILMYWTMSNLGKNLTDTVVTRAEATLVTSGPYRWVRHPFYVTAAWMMASVTLLSANWLIGASSLFVLGLLAIRTPKEEQRLVERFGEEYQNYMAKTGRFFPRISSSKEAKPE